MDDEIPYYKEVKVAGDSFINKLKRVSTSALFFITTFILSNLLLQVLIARMAVALKYKTRFTYTIIHVLPWDYHYWSRTNIVLIYFLPPIACFVMGLFIFNLLQMYTNRINIFRLFFFWFSVNITNLVLTNALLSPLGSPSNRSNGLYQTFAVVGAFLWISPVLMFIVAVGALVVTILFGTWLRKEVLRYSFSNKLIKNKRGMDLVVVQVFMLPVLAGSLPVISLCGPIGFFTTVMQLANLGVISIGIFMMNSIEVTTTVRCSKDDVLNRFPIIELAICVAVWFVVFAFFK